MKNNQKFSLGIVMIAGIFISACSSSPTPNYYTLQAKVTPIKNSGISVIEVLPVGLPDRLDRASIVLQDQQGKSKVLDNDRWTSTLSTQLRDGLSAGLQQKLGAVDRYNSGMTAGQVSYRIATDFSNFDVIENSNLSTFAGSNDPYVNVMVTWIIKPDISAAQSSGDVAQKNLENRTLSCRASFTVPIHSTSRNVNNIVVASTQALNQVIDQIAESVVMMNSNKNKIVNTRGATCN